MYLRLRDLREDADLNQTQVANFLGMSQTGYSNYELIFPWSKLHQIRLFLFIFQRFGKYSV